MQICLEIAGSYTISKKNIPANSRRYFFSPHKVLWEIGKALDIPWFLERADLTQLGQGISFQPGNKF